MVEISDENQVLKTRIQFRYGRKKLRGNQVCKTQVP